MVFALIGDIALNIRTGRRTDRENRIAILPSELLLSNRFVDPLRNVEKTGPYFHNGQVGSMDLAVKLMGQHQLNLELNETQVQDIVSWLKTLTGEIPKDYIAKPQLPQ